ncbi:MAG TPA: GPW/gp25 family protein [Candidatus Solibacter sp.]|nr:GPW/gp25 family protein [Candidatus Solibacter sp.]
MVEENASVRQAILILLTTSPGERVMRPDYGCNLKKLVFSPNDDTTAGLALHFVRQALSRWEPRIQVLRLDAGANPIEAFLLDIVLDYRVRATRRSDQIKLSLSLAGERT